MRIAIVGQTGSGKSDVAIELAQRLGNGAIISADAYQLYHGMDIGTAKVPLKDRRGIEHYQLDVLDIFQSASVAAYQRSARQDAKTIESVGQQVIMAGGSGLYIRAVLDDLSFPGTDPQLREKIQRRGEALGWQCLHDELRARDPVSAERIPAENTRRVIRALEVCELTGRPFSATLPEYKYVEPWIQIGLRWNDDDLEALIDARSQKMFDSGFLDEISKLMNQGFENTPTASRACGYPQAISVWRGEISLQEGVDAVAQETKRLAKRQWKWFKRDPRIHWVSMSDIAEELAGTHDSSQPLMGSSKAPDSRSIVGVACDRIEQILTQYG